ncbi:DUF3817 domain-containing protein [Actinoplanes aureus]|uniref:DUF3817 domain-containing protein n=1 Tax=Actinoplanes aureus TaxID=2792083 RepID=UPI0028169CB6|nr:DUF3817 domain-containing protein [Actinoplanes aureus]
MPRRPLEIAAVAELLSLAVLLVNLATAHVPQVTSLGGPVHGCAYLFVVILTAWHPAASRRTRLLAAIPGVGGLLATRALRAGRSQ